LNSLAALLPFITLLAATIAVSQRVGDLRHSALRAAILCGAFAVISLEILSQLGMIEVLAMIILWVGALVSILIYLARRARAEGGLVLPSLSWPDTWSEWATAGGLAVILLLTGFIAWFAPPNTWDALNYHMPRVAHWAQQGSLAHFATGIEFQNYLPPGASYLVLHLYILGQGDHWVNFVQWFAMAGSLIGVTWIAQKLGAGRFGQWAAAVFAATLPMGILQATSAVNDFVVAFWMVCIAAELLDMEENRLSITNLTSMAGAAGLALVTKHTSIPYLTPFALGAAILLTRRRRERSLIPGALIGLLLVVVLNWGYLNRNMQTYGGLAGPQERVGNQATQTLDPRALASNILRNASLQAGTPSRYVNKAIAVAITWLHERVGFDVNDSRTTSEGVFRVKPPITHETVASNPLQAYFVFIASACMLIRRQRFPQVIRSYAWLCLAGFFLLSILFQWKVTGARYHLPFFVLFAPGAGWMLGSLRSRVFAASIAGVFFLGAIPALFLNPSRPLLNGVAEASVGSVLIEPREALYFANAGHEDAPYREMTRRVREAACQSAGLMLPGGEIEYQVWALMGAPSEDLRIEWIVAGTPSARYQAAPFQPCAVYCLECPPGWGESSGLASDYRAGPFQLLVRPPADVE
jgi:4-amino-4-deoxy-L-arabinose transferase-like glycosyltransferase